jgi:SAM-dependent methyltransferase
LPVGEPEADLSWRDYWNTETSIYVSARHKAVHDARVAADIARLLPKGSGVVLDHGCGEASAAGDIARRVERLLLCDGAPNVRARLQERYRGRPGFSVLAPEDIAREVADGSLDAVVANSLLQYLSREELGGLVDLWHRKLKPGGTLIIGDVIPPDLGALADARALLGFAVQGGFLFAALAGLVRTAFSDYRKLRAEVGLTTFSEAEFLALLDGAGFEPRRHRPNIGHNQARMTFIATRR